MNEAKKLINENMNLFSPFNLHSRLNADDELTFPLDKRVIIQYFESPSGTQELHLSYGDREILFDESELFEFVEDLAKQSRFIAKTATQWGCGYEWSRIKKLFEQLIEEGILQYADTYDAVTPTTANEDCCPSLLPPASTAVSRTWLEVEEISDELTGHILEIGYLELAIPIFRVAHIFMDAEGRQLGEANVFPKPLRIDMPTDWRICPYSGSRYRDERPMNVTALKSACTYWPQMMVALFRIREAFLQRFPSERHGWTVGGLEALATLVLAVPTYLLMRSHNRVENGELHPALSSLFRVTDGLRTVMHQMIFAPVGGLTLLPNAPMSSAEIYAYAERNYAFSSAHGVCAGSKAMIEEFLNVLVNGVPIKDAESVVLEKPVETALEDINSAFDYGLYGLQAFAVIFSFWPMMTCTYVQLWTIVEAWSGGRSNKLITFRERLQTQINTLNNRSYSATEEWRVKREQAYSEIYAFCAMGFGLPAEEKTLTERLTPAMKEDHVQMLEQLRTILQRHFGCSSDSNDPDVESIVICLMNFFLQAQAIVRLACQTQEPINTLLGRALPMGAFDVAAINIHNLLQGDEKSRLSFIINELEEIFNLRIIITKDSIEIIEIEHLTVSSRIFFQHHPKNYVKYSFNPMNFAQVFWN